MTFNESVDTTNKIINNDLYNFISKDLIDYYNKVGDFINLINFSSSSKINLSKISLEDFLINLINEKYYKKDSYIKNNIYKFIEFYLLRLTILNKSKNEMKSLYTNFINKIYYLKKFNLDEESFFIEFKSKVFNE